MLRLLLKEEEAGKSFENEHNEKAVN